MAGHDSPVAEEAAAAMRRAVIIAKHAGEVHPPQRVEHAGVEAARDEDEVRGKASSYVQRPNGVEPPASPP